jgi:hypothetical protein
VDEALSGPLIEEAARKSGLVWVTVGASRPHPAWHVWRDAALYLVTGGGEQPLPGLAEAAETGAEVAVTVRSKDKGGRLVTFQARPVRVSPGTGEWDAAAGELSAKRLNAVDSAGQPERWAAHSTVLRLEPTGVVSERPGAMPDGGHAATPAGSPARTRVRRPFTLGRRR